VNNLYILTAATIIVGMVIASTLITYSNFKSLPTATFGDHGEGFEDTYEDWFENRGDDNSNYYQQSKQQQDEFFEKSNK
jgi:hypothetical protein